MRAGATPYRNAAAGVLYRRQPHGTPSAIPTSQAQATQPAFAPPAHQVDSQTSGATTGWGVGLALIVVGCAVAVSNWLRRSVL